MMGPTACLVKFLPRRNRFSGTVGVDGFRSDVMTRWFRCVVVVSLVLMAVCVSSSRSMADESASGELSEELLAKARELIKGWDRPAPRIAFSEKWRVALPIREFAPVAWASESDRLAVLSREAEVLVLDASNGRELARFKGKAEDRSDCPEAKGLPRCIAMSPDGKHVAIGCTAGVLVWNWQANKVEFVHNAAAGGVTEVRISGNGQQIVFADRRKGIGYYPFLGGNGAQSNVTTPLGNHATDLAINHDGTRYLARLSRTEPFTEMISVEPGKLFGRPGAFAANLSDPICAAAGQTLRVLGNSKGGLTVFESPDKVDSPNSPISYVVVPFDHVHRVYISRDESLAMATTSGGDVAARPADTSHAFWVGSIPSVRIRDVRSDFRALAAVTASGELVRFDIQPMASHPAREMEIWAHEAIKRKAYDEIDAVFAVAAKEGRFAFDQSMTKFARLAEEFDRVPIRTEGRAAFLEAQKEWLATHSHRVGAAYVGAMANVQLAWQARGTGFAFTVAEEGAEKFRKHLLIAHELLDPFFNGDEQPPVDLYDPWFEVGKGAGWPANVIRHHISELARRVDGWYPGCHTAAELLLPRWHGEPDDCHKFACLIRDQVGGDAGKMAYARIATGLYGYHGNDVWIQDNRRDSTETLGFNYPETLAGLKLVFEKGHPPPQFIEWVWKIARDRGDNELVAAIMSCRERILRGEQ